MINWRSNILIAIITAFITMSIGDGDVERIPIYLIIGFIGACFIDIISRERNDR